MSLCVWEPRWWLCDTECRGGRGVGSWAEEEKGPHQKFLQVKLWLSGFDCHVRPSLTLDLLFCFVVIYL